MGLFDFTCCRCGHLGEGGIHSDFGGKRCTASVLVKQQDGRWVEQTFAGVYDGYGRIITRADGKRPRKDKDGWLTYDQQAPSIAPGESKIDFWQRFDEWKTGVTREMFHVVEARRNGVDAEFRERQFAEIEANPSLLRRFESITLRSLIAFNVMCDNCSERKGYWPLPGAVSALETFADFRARVPKMNAHKQVADAEQALTGAQERMTKAPGGVVRSQEALARVQEEVARAQEEVAKSQSAMAEASRIVLEKRQARDAFHESIPFFAMIDPKGDGHDDKDDEQCHHCRKRRRIERRYERRPRLGIQSR